MIDNSKIKEKDELYQTAVEIIKSEEKALHLFTKKLQIGYNRAARIIDMMEADGIVSKANMLVNVMFYNENLMFILFNTNNTNFSFYKKI